MPEAEKGDRKTISLTREAWNFLRELQVAFDADTYSETLLEFRVDNIEDRQVDEKETKGGE